MISIHKNGYTFDLEWQMKIIYGNELDNSDNNGLNSCNNNNDL